VQVSAFEELPLPPCPQTTFTLDKLSLLTAEVFYGPKSKYIFRKVTNKFLPSIYKNVKKILVLNKSYIFSRTPHTGVTKENKPICSYL